MSHRGRDRDDACLVSPALASRWRWSRRRGGGMHGGGGGGGMHGGGMGGGMHSAAWGGACTAAAWAEPRVSAAWAESRALAAWAEPRISAAAISQVRVLHTRILARIFEGRFPRAALPHALPSPFQSVCVLWRYLTPTPLITAAAGGGPGRPTDCNGSTSAATTVTTNPAETRRKAVDGSGSDASWLVLVWRRGRRVSRRSGRCGRSGTWRNAGPVGHASGPAGQSSRSPEMTCNWFLE